MENSLEEKLKKITKRKVKARLGENDNDENIIDDNGKIPYIEQVNPVSSKNLRKIASLTTEERDKILERIKNSVNKK